MEDRPFMPSRQAATRAVPGEGDVGPMGKGGTPTDAEVPWLTTSYSAEFMGVEYPAADPPYLDGTTALMAEGYELPMLADHGKVFLRG